MINLPAKFTEFLNKAKSAPATIVKFADTLLEDIQSSSGDWENNSSETQVDYATEPGSVILEAGTIPSISQEIDDSSLILAITPNPFTAEPSTGAGWQSFKQTTGADKLLDEVNVLFTATLHNNGTVYCQVYDSFQGAAASAIISGSIANGNTNKLFDFGAESVVIKNNVTYWLKIYASIDVWYVDDVINLRYTSSNLYADGQLNRVITTGSAWANANNIGDADFDASFTGEYYLTSGNITTQIIDLGETPAVDGEWKFEDLRPDDYGTTAIVYTCSGSTDNFVASDVSIGTKTDGDPIEAGDWYRYYKINAALTTTDENETPVVESMGLSFVGYLTYSNRDIYGYETSLDTISSLSTKIDDFSFSTVSQLTCTLGFSKTISNYLYTAYPKNKTARVLIGYDDSTFLETDFLEIYVGLIDDWKISNSHYVDITLKDAAKAWDVDIPKETTTADSNYVSGTYQALNISADHPVDVMLEILQNHIDTRDAAIDFGSFEEVKASLAGWVVTRNLTGEQEGADGLLNELRILTSTYFLPSAVGKIKLKEYDSAEAAIETLTDDDFMTPLAYESNISALKNKAFLEFDWGGASYGHVYISLDSTSYANNNEVKTFKLEDKWTLNAQVAQIQALKTYILGRYAAPPMKLTGVTDRKKLYLEVGDMVNITTTQAPSSDLSGITATKFQIVEANFNQTKNTIKFVFLEV